MRIDKLHYITQGKTEDDILKEVLEFVVAGGRWLQLRIKDSGQDILRIAQKVKTICCEKTTFIINDYVGVAKSVNADGVHLGSEDMPIPEARAILGRNKIIGGTSNTFKDCIALQQQGVNYIGLGPYAFTKTKTNISPILGIEGCMRITNNDKIYTPIVVVGGIEMEDISALAKTKITGIACSTLIYKSENKRHIISNIYKLLNIDE